MNPLRRFVRRYLWPLSPEQAKALGQVLLALGVSSTVAAASLLFLPTPLLSAYDVVVRVAALCALVAVAIPGGLILHLVKGED